MSLEYDLIQLKELGQDVKQILAKMNNRLEQWSKKDNADQLLIDHRRDELLTLIDFTAIAANLTKAASSELRAQYAKGYKKGKADATGNRPNFFADPQKKEAYRNYIDNRAKTTQPHLF